MPDGLSRLQRHCLMALEVDVYNPRPVAKAVPIRQPVQTVATSGQSALPAGPLLLLVADADREAALALALAHALGATLQRVDAPRPGNAVLVSIGAVTPDAALTLPPLVNLRGDARLKQRSWLEIRSFLRLRRSHRS